MAFIGLATHPGAAHAPGRPHQVLPSTFLPDAAGHIPRLPSTSETSPAMKLPRNHFLRRWPRYWMREWDFMSLGGRIILIGLLILPPAAWFTWKPARTWVQERRVQQRIQAAEQALEQGEFAAAASFARAAKQAGGHDQQVERILAESLQAVRDPNALNAHITIISNPQALRADRLQAFRLLVAAFPHGDVRRLWQILSPSEHKDLDFRLAMADRVLADGDFRSALRFLHDTQSTRLEAVLEIRRIRAWILTGTFESLDLAHRALIELWQTLPQHRADWIGLIEEIPLQKLDPLRLAELEPDLLAMPPGPSAARGALLVSRLRLAEALAAGDEAARTGIVRTCVGQWLDTEPLSLGSFLVHAQAWESLSDHFTDALVEGRPELVQARLEALARLGLKMRIPLTLNRPQNAIESYWRHAWRAACHHHAADTSEVKAAWNLALQEAGGEAKDTILLELAAHALRHGMISEHDSAMLAAIRRGLGPLPSFGYHRRLIERLEQQGAENELMTLLATYRALEPWETEIEARYCHLSALLGTEPIPDCLAALEALAARENPSVHLRGILACLHLLAGDSQRSLEQWQSLPVSRDSLAPRFQTAWQIAAIHAEAREKLATPAVPANLNWSALLPTERRHYQRLLRVEESTDSLPELPPLPTASPLPDVPPLPAPSP
jgi:hypothetical protein